jgi:uncharacterized protein (DUF1697 family)
MADRKEHFVALLRGINVGGRNKVPMAALRAICTGIHCDAVQTYIQSGNVVLSAALPAATLERRLEQAIEKEFGFPTPVIVRSASSWRRYVKSNPFPLEADKEGNWILLSLSKLPPKDGAVSELQQHATQGERVLRKGDAIWIHYASGIARSKLTPDVLDRVVGSPVTARNWRTVLKLDEMIRARAAG